MPKKIAPKAITAIDVSSKTINPYGYYRRFIQVRGPLKRETTGQSAYSKFARGYSPGIQFIENYSNKDIIRESISSIIKKTAKTHVNEYLKSSDGRKLQQEVRDLIRKKIDKKTI